MRNDLWEWVEDCYHDDYAGAPTHGSAWMTGTCRTNDRNDALHVVHGGFSRARLHFQASHRGPRPPKLSRCKEVAIVARAPSNPSPEIGEHIGSEAAKLFWHATDLWPFALNRKSKHLCRDRRL